MRVLHIQVRTIDDVQTVVDLIVERQDTNGNVQILRKKGGKKKALSHIDRRDYTESKHLAAEIYYRYNRVIDKLLRDFRYDLSTL